MKETIFLEEMPEGMVIVVGDMVLIGSGKSSEKVASGK